MKHVPRRASLNNNASTTTTLIYTIIISRAANINIQEHGWEMHVCVVQSAALGFPWSGRSTTYLPYLHGSGTSVIFLGFPTIAVPSFR